METFLSPVNIHHVDNIFVLAFIHVAAMWEEEVFKYLAEVKAAFHHTGKTLHYKYNYLGV